MQGAHRKGQVCTVPIVYMWSTGPTRSVVAWSKRESYLGHCTVDHPNKRCARLWCDDHTLNFATLENGLHRGVHRSPQLELDIPAARPCRKYQCRAVNVVGRLYEHPVECRVHVCKVIRRGFVTVGVAWAECVRRVHVGRACSHAAVCERDPADWAHAHSCSWGAKPWNR